MHLHVLQHEPHEGPAGILPWGLARGHRFTFTHADLGDPLPSPSDLDWLIVMGGSMNVYEEAEYPWLIQEKRLIEAVIRSGRGVLGLCLGAQLIASVLGARVVRNAYPEIGWFPVEKTKEAPPLFDAWPVRADAFHWHGDTFQLPAGATHVARSQACENQAFVYNDHVLALQFHPEATPESVEQMIQTGVPPSGPFVQSAGKMRENPERFLSTGGLLNHLLDNFQKITASPST
jgi:GMP synthase (glutamine-hydrolysing)